MKTPNQETNLNALEILLDLIPDKQLPFKVQIIDSKYPINFCTENVINQVKELGGERILGWQIWDYGYMISAEFHAIWKSPEGDFFDITPKEDKQLSHILFVPDSFTIYQGKQIDNLRVNVNQNKLVDDLIFLEEIIFNIKNRGNRELQHGEIYLIGEEAHLLEHVFKIIDGIKNLLSEQKTRNSNCFCRSLSRYKHCHGKDLRQKINSVFHKL